MDIIRIGYEILDNISDLILKTYNINYAVIGEGDINSNVLIIGEAMGREEEKQKRIFIGRSGYILRNCLNSNLVSSFFIINTMPIRPTNNRTPTYKEILLFSNYYKEIINLPQFSKLITLGKSAETLVSILGKKDVIKTYHPAYILYNRNNKSIFNKFNNSIKELRSENYQYTVRYHIIRKEF